MLLFWLIVSLVCCVICALRMFCLSILAWLFVDFCWVFSCLYLLFDELITVWFRCVIELCLLMLVLGLIWLLDWLTCCGWFLCWLVLALVGLIVAFVRLICLWVYCCVGAWRFCLMFMVVYFLCFVFTEFGWTYIYILHVWV